MTDEEFRELILNFLIERRPDQAAEVRAIADDVDLIEAGLLDSLAFLDMCMLIEEKTGKMVDIVELEPDEFSSIRALRAIISAPAEG